jgi:hypothetical protein
LVNQSGAKAGHGQLRHGLKPFFTKIGSFRIASDGRDEYKLLVPELMRNAWVEQVSIEDKEVKPLGGLYAVEFDDKGEIDIYFAPLRPGTYRVLYREHARRRHSGDLRRQVALYSSRCPGLRACRSDGTSDRPLTGAPGDRWCSAARLFQHLNVHAVWRAGTAERGSAYGIS